MGNARELNGAVVVVTGSARGIGAATATAFRDAGARVVIADIDDVALHEAEATIRPALALHLDVTDRSSFEELFDRVESELGPVDVLVNNVGIMPITKVTDMSDALSQRLFDINVKGMMLGTRVALDRMVPRAGGHVINVSSMLGVIPGPGLAEYCATKAAIIMFTDSARVELRHTGVDLSVVLPGQTNTELTSGAQPVRGLSLVSPDRIAAAIVRLARRPRRRAYAPLTFGVIAAACRYLPQSVTEPLVGWLGGDALLETLDADARRAYDERIGARDLGTPTGGDHLATADAPTSSAG